MIRWNLRESTERSISRKRYELNFQTPYLHCNHSLLSSVTLVYIKFNDVVVGLGGCQNTRGKQCFTKTCCSSMYCSTAQKCKNKRTEGQSCDAVRRVSSKRCIVTLVDSSNHQMTYRFYVQCASGLSCQPGVHKCYHSPREFGEPCSAGYGCGSGLSCQPGVQRVRKLPQLFSHYLLLAY